MHVYSTESNIVLYGAYIQESVYKIAASNSCEL